MEILQDKSMCSGCGACYNICNHNAIVMKPNSEGFLYPMINEQKCVNCGLCRKTCPINNSLENAFHEAPVCYAAKNKDINNRMVSSSGGIFSLLAEIIISSGGVVAGAAFDDNYKYVSHIIVDNMEKMKLLRGSKYVQSSIGLIYRKIKQVLNEEKLVLFSGTGCQIAGLKNYLNQDYPNLFTIDVVCHGVPSPKLWEEYLSELEREFGGSSTFVSFRAKQNGWENFGLHINCNQKTYFRTLDDDPYLSVFQKNLSLRESCYKCKLKSDKGISDISIGDLWGAKSIAPELYDDKGISFVMAHNEKGRKLLDRILVKCEYTEILLEDAVSNNKNISKSAIRPKNRSSFYSDFKKMNALNLCKKYNRMPFKHVIRELLRKIGLLEIARVLLRHPTDGGGVTIDDNLRYGLLVRFK